MKQWLGYVVLGVLAYIAFIIMTFPAERAVGFVQSQIPQLRLSGVSGSAWDGRAAMAQYQGQRLQRLEWNFNPTGLLFGQIEFDLAFDGEGRSGKGAVGLGAGGDLTLSDVELRIPAAEIDQMIRLPVSLDGMVEMQLEELVAEGKVIKEAVGEVRWRQAGIRSPIKQTLGNFVAQLTTGDEGVQAQVKDEGGPLQLEGTWRLSPDGSYRFNANALVRDGQQQLLQQGLRSLGKVGADGRVALEFTGRLQ